MFSQGNGWSALKRNQPEEYERSQEKLKEWGKQKIICSCGASITNSSFHTHKNTNKHRDFHNLPRWVRNDPKTYLNLTHPNRFLYSKQ